VRHALTAIVALALMAQGCGAIGPNSSDGTLGEDRPARYNLPTNRSVDGPMPVVVLLHGYGADAGRTARTWLGVAGDIRRSGALLIYPEGVENTEGKEFWNATDFCCDFDGKLTDDVGYITELIEEAHATFDTDPSRVTIIGQSNGGFMAHRIACERPDLIAGIANVTGATWYDEADCTAPAPLSVLHAHGTADDATLYDGKAPDAEDEGHASSEAGAERWARIHGCPHESTRAPSRHSPRPPGRQPALSGLGG